MNPVLEAHRELGLLVVAQVPSTNESHQHLELLLADVGACLAKVKLVDKLSHELELHVEHVLYLGKYFQEEDLLAMGQVLTPVHLVDLLHCHHR